MNWLRKLFKKKKTLRDKVVEMYGEEAGVYYDNLSQGIPIGGLLKTAVFTLTYQGLALWITTFRNYHHLFVFAYIFTCFLKRNCIVVSCKCLLRYYTC